MLISVQIKKAIENEIKSQQTLIKVLEKQEAMYNADAKAILDHAKKTIAFYDKVLKEAA